MENQVTFVNGMIAKRQDNAPDFVLCNLSLKVDDLINFMQQHNNNGWVNIDVKRSKAGKVFAALNTWKPTATNGGGQVANGGQYNQQAPQNGGQVGYGQQVQTGDVPF